MYVKLEVAGDVRSSSVCVTCAASRRWMIKRRITGPKMPHFTADVYVEYSTVRLGIGGDIYPL
jgi:hypothetical protein